MALDLGALRVRVTADTSDAEKGLSNLKKTGESIAKVGTKLTAGLTTPIVAVGTASVMASAHVQEMESKFNTVFKTISAEADAWSTNYANAIGRSKYEIKEAISNQADLMIGMGMTEEVAGDLSKKYTSLAYDLASFNNVNDATALEAMTKAMFGETEMAKQLGLNLNATTMENSEYVKSLGKSWSALTQAERAEAYYQEALKQSVNAVGDAERTSDSFTNQLKRLKGGLYDLSVEIGKVMIPFLTEVASGMNEVISKVTQLLADNPALAQTIVAIGLALATLGPGLLIVGKLMVLFDKLPAVATACGIASVAIGLLGIAWLGSNEQAQQALSDMTTNLATFMADTTAKIQAVAPQVLQVGTEIINNFVNGLATGIPVVLSTIMEITKILVDTFMNVMPTILTVGIQLITNLITGIAQALPKLMTTVLNLTLDMLNWFLESLPKWVNNGMKVITSLVQGIAQALPQIVQAVFNTATSMLDTLIKRMPEFLARGKDTILNIIDGLKQQLPSLLDTMLQAILKTLTVIADKMPEFLKKGIEFVTKMVAGIGQNLPTIIAKIAELLGLLIAKIIEYLPQFLAKGAEIVVKIIAGLIQGIPSLVSAGVQIMKGVLQGVGSMISSFANVGGQIVQSIKNGISNAWGSLTNWVSDKVKSIPVVGGFFKMAPTPEDGVQTYGLSTAIEGATAMARDSGFGNLFSDLSLFGALPKVNNTYKPRHTNTINAQQQKPNNNVTFNNNYQVTNKTEFDMKSSMETMAYRQKQQLRRAGVI